MMTSTIVLCSADAERKPPMGLRKIIQLSLGSFGHLLFAETTNFRIVSFGLLIFGPKVLTYGRMVTLSIASWTPQIDSYLSL
jgi:hypothetical protein